MNHQDSERGAGGSGWLSLPDVARHFGVSTYTIRRRIREGRLPAEKRPGRFGEQYFVPSWALETGDGDQTSSPLPEPDNGGHHAEPVRGRPLIGRRAEREALRSALRACMDGRGSVVLIAGDSGVGKTTLVQTLIDDAIAAGVLAIGARCYDLDSATPYRAWLEMFRPDRLPADLPVAAPQVSSKDALEAAAGGRDLPERVVSFIVELARHRPILIVLGDLQWADRHSIDLLRYVGRRAADRAILVAVTYRPGDVAPDQPLYRLLPNLIRETGAQRMTLREWDRDDVAELISLRYELSEDAQSRLVDFLLAYSEGNPFFVNELLHELEFSSVLQPSSSGWVLGDLTGVRVPALLRQIIDSRLEHLDAEARDLLQAAAVIGDEVPVDLWQQVVGVSEEVLVDVLQQALDAQVMVEMPREPKLRFRHVLIRQSLYERMILLRRRVWHRKIAEILAAEPDPDPDAVARHFLEASDPRAADWLIASGRRAARAFAFQFAAAQFERALTTLEDDESRKLERAWLLCDLAESYRYTFPARAMEKLDGALRIAEELDHEALQTVVFICRARVAFHDARNAFNDLRDGMQRLAGLRPEDRSFIAGSALGYAVSRATFAQSLAHYGTYGLAAEEAQRFLDESPSTDPREHGNAHFALGLAYAALARPSDARAAFARARAFFSQAGTHHLIAATYDWEIDLILQCYAPEKIEERHRLLELAATEWRHSVFGSVVPPEFFPTIVDSLLLDGRWEEARGSATALLRANAQRLGSLRVLADLDRLQGNPGRAWAHIAEALPDGPDTAPPLSHFPYALRLVRIAAEMAIDDGELDWARRWILCLERWLAWTDAATGRAAPDHLWARYYEAQADLDRAWQHQLDGLARAREPRQPLELLTAHRTLGRLAIGRRDYQSATEHLMVAEDLAASFGAPYELALSRLARAELLIATGRDSEATALLGAVRSTAEELGAVPLIDAIDRLEPRRSSVPGGLSAREIEVLRLVAEGLTDTEIGDRLFISPRTVSGHLQSIYNKLGISSRTAATAFAYKHRLV